MGGSSSSPRLGSEILADPEHEKVSIPDVESHYPPPKPPRCQKRELFKIEEYAEIDERARQAPEDLNLNWKDLIEYLTQGLTIDLQRVRSLFVWLGSRDIDGGNYGNIKNKSSPIAMMKSVKDKQTSYAVFFTKLCRSANVPCVLIRGYGKSGSYLPGDSIEKVKAMYSIWTAVYVQDSWQIIVPLWAFVSDIDHNDGKYNNLLESGEKETEEEQLIQVSGIHRKIDEYFFLADPENIRMVLYTKDPNWQLSKLPLTIERFCSVPYLRKHYFKYKLRITSHFEACLHADKGISNIVIESDPKWDGFLKYKLIYDSDESGNVNDGNIHLSRYVIMERQIGKWNFVIRFPTTGVYRMHIFGGRIADLFAGSINWVCSFKLICEEVGHSVFPIPCGTGILGVGANSGLEQAGLHTPSHTSGIIKVNARQEIDLSFLLTEKVTIISKLFHSNFTPKVLKKQLVQRLANGRLHINVTIPQAGDYILRIFSKGEENDQEENICNYLLTTNDPTGKRKTRENPTEKRARHTLQAISETMTRPEEIDDAIDRFCKLQLEDHGDLTRAYDQREYLRIKIELEEAMLRSHNETLEKAMKQAKNSKYADTLAELLQKAEELNEQLRRLDKYVYDILDMKQSTVSELHGYKYQPLIHDVMKATYTMLGEKKVDLEDWEEIVWLVRQVGKDSLLNRVNKLDVQHVKYSTIEVVQKILKPYTEETVRATSAVAATFYIWCTNICDDFNLLSIKRNKPRNRPKRK